MIRVLIVDDEAPARERLKRLLETFKEIEILGEASNGLEALKLNNELKPDVLFLDIEMPELNGLETADAIDIGGPIIVFVTAYDEHALRAFETNSVDYLVKPIATKRLAQTIEKLKKWGVNPSRRPPASWSQLQKLAVHSGAKYNVIETSRISAIISKDHYSYILADGKEILSDDSLDALSKRLNVEKFIRVHRNAIINIDFVQQLIREGDRKYDAVLSDPLKTRVSISREKLKTVLTATGATDSLNLN
jgi:two-component system, LytTR family, response regulator